MILANEPQTRPPARTLVPWLAGIAAVMLALAAVILLVHFTTDVNVRIIVSDPAETALLPEYAGAYSHLGVLVLWTAGVISVVAGVVTRGRRPVDHMSSLFIGLGVLICWLAADDLFMWHEWIGLALARLAGATDVHGMRTQLEAVVFAVYGLACLAWAARFRRILARTDVLLLLLAVVCFGLSMGIDVGTYMFPSFVPDELWAETTLAVAEEKLKLAGTFVMLAYVLRIAIPVIRHVPNATELAGTRATAGPNPK